MERREDSARPNCPAVPPQTSSHPQRLWPFCLIFTITWNGCIIMDIRPWPQTETCENRRCDFFLSLSFFQVIFMYKYIKITWKIFGNKKKCLAMGVCIWKKWPVLKGKWGKNIQKTQNSQKWLFKVWFGFLRCNFLIRAPKVPFLEPTKWLNWGRFSHLGGTRNIFTSFSLEHRPFFSNANPHG